MNYKLGFSWKGLIVFLLPMIPNIFYFLIPVSASTLSSDTPFLLSILEHGSQAVFVFLLLFFVGSKSSDLLCPYTILMMISLLTYYIFWIFYFFGTITILILLGLAILPVIYFILAEIWLHNYPAIIPTMVFGLSHVIVTYLGY